MAPQGAPPGQGLEQVLPFVLLQLSLIIVMGRVAGGLAQRLGQPRAVGEMLAGLLLGPSLFGRLAPAAQAFVFESTDTLPIGIISQIGLILLMFQIGLEFDFSHLQAGRNKRAAIAVALVGIVCPFIFGFGFGFGSSATLAPFIDRSAYSLFLATAFSITAVPVLGRIMMEYGLTQTRIGVITIAAAAITDAIGWTLLALISTWVTSRLAPLDTLLQLGYLGLYGLACWSLLRPLLRWLVRVMRRGDDVLTQDLMALLLAAVFLSAIVTNWLGLFAIFGGFVIGMLLHDQRALVDAWKARAADLVMVFFMPVFFTYTGLRTDVGHLDSPQLWGAFALALLLAATGKFGGCYLAARWSGLDASSSRNVAIMMNTRGLLELVIANVGLDLGVIPPSVFTMLVLMAVLSTMMTAPALRRWLPRSAKPADGRHLPAG
ncbi:sodium:proton antiporter [Methylolobus aquaticus]|nr:sodium:proton antiporter [Methylolobus aquaticus]